MKSSFKLFAAQAWRVCATAAIAAVGFFMTACITLQDLARVAEPPPQPTSIVITGIPASHNERRIVVRLLDADSEVAVAHPGHIIDGSVRLDMLEAGTETPIFARGNYVVDIEISIAVLGRPLPVPMFLGITAPRNVSEGVNSIPWTDFTPTPVSITITEIPPAHNGRMATLRLLALGIGDGIGLDLATAPPAPIAGGTVTINLVNPETQEQFFARGAYALAVTITEQPAAIFGMITPPPIPRWGGISAVLNITGGAQNIPFASFAGAGF